MLRAARTSRTGGALGTALAQQHLRNILAHLDVPVMGQPEAFINAGGAFFDSAGKVQAESVAFLQKWIDSYLAWIKKHTA